MRTIRLIQNESKTPNIIKRIKSQIFYEVNNAKRYFLRSKNASDIIYEVNNAKRYFFRKRRKFYELTSILQEKKVLAAENTLRNRTHYHVLILCTTPAKEDCY